MEPDKKRMEALELVALYAKDVVNAWPSITFRTLRNMCQLMDNLKDALKRCE